MKRTETTPTAEATGGASWLVAMVLFVVLAVAVIVALFAWALWDDDDIGGGIGTDIGENIDVNVDEGDQLQGGGEQPQPQLSP